MTTIQRTHDSFYLQEDRYEKPKQMFTEIIDAMTVAGPPAAGAVIADFGCAAGEFAFALQRAFPQAVVEGYDLLPELIERARLKVPAARFFVGSVTDRGLCAEGHVDYTLCTGVLSIFDSFEPTIGNLIAWTKPGGHVFLQGLFNEFPVDVNIKYNLSADYGTGVLEAGWNIFSKATVSRWLAAHPDVKTFSFTDFRLSVDLAPQADPARSWTRKDADGNRFLTNGLSFIQPHAILHLVKK